MPPTANPERTVRNGDHTLAARRKSEIIVPESAHATEAVKAVNLSTDRVEVRKLADQKAKARTLARTQAVAEKLSSATEEVSTAIQQASGAVQGNRPAKPSYDEGGWCGRMAG